MERQHIKFNQGCLLVLKMTQSELDQVNRYINVQIASRSVIPDKSDEDIDFLVHAYPLKTLKTMRTLTMVMQNVLRDYCVNYIGEDLIGEPTTDLLFGIELVNNN